MIKLKNNWIKRIERKSAPYIENNYLRLDKSERQQDFPKKYFDKFIKSLSQSDFSFYPNTDNLTKLISKHNDVKCENINISFGSDYIIKSWFEIFAFNGSNIVTTNPCFPMYKVYADMYDSKLNCVNYNKNLQFNISDLINKIDDKTSFVVIANPNSPIGDFKSISEIESLVKYTNKKRIPILIDEAYYEYNDYVTCIELIKSYNNVGICRTFSKAFGGAGCRIGYGISPIEISTLLNKVKPTFEATGPSIKFCEFVLNNKNLSKEYVASVINEKSKIINILRSKNFDVLDSKSNWIHFNNKNDNTDVDKVLLNYKVSYKNNLIIPHDSRKNWIRISIIPNLRNESFIKEL